MSNQSETKHWDVWCEFNGVVALSVTAEGVMDNYNREALQAMLLSQQSAAIRAPVPPAGDVEVLALQDVANAYIRQGDVSGALEVVADILGHVTRLTAERDGLLAQLTESRRQVQLLNEAGEFLDDVSQGVEDKLRAENAALQYELTKARELLIRLRNCKWIPTAEWQHEVSEVLAHQSAPAAKGGSDE